MSYIDTFDIIFISQNVSITPVTGNTDEINIECFYQSSVNEKYEESGE